jgi:hypothetical protein
MPNINKVQNTWKQAQNMKNNEKHQVSNIKS